MIMVPTRSPSRLEYVTFATSFLTFMLCHRLKFMLDWFVSSVSKKTVYSDPWCNVHGVSWSEYSNWNKVNSPFARIGYASTGFVRRYPSFPENKVCWSYRNR